MVGSYAVYSKPQEFEGKYQRTYKTMKVYGEVKFEVHDILETNLGFYAQDNGSLKNVSVFLNGANYAKGNVIAQVKIQKEMRLLLRNGTNSSFVYLFAGNQEGRENISIDLSTVRVGNVDENQERNEKQRSRANSKLWYVVIGILLISLFVAGVLVRFRRKRGERLSLIHI
eukprot:TRINITY_DN12943_c0_g1_i1.p1 TRINITY_DN12943_c0_g1~~TRINITY_DN12943_c0_g1_i1.p1  ORF type:complete len:171 (+),score=22.04 TRINITY_DN12943_c0_g1_i1:194-706(+)